MKFEFTFRSGPDWMTVKKVQQTYDTVVIAEAFAEGLRRGGAGNVSFKEIEDETPKEYLCIVCHRVPVDPSQGMDTCLACCQSI